MKNKTFKKDIIDRKRISIILKNISKKSKAKKIDPKITIKFNNDKKLDGVMRKKLNLDLAKSYRWESKMNFSKALDEIIVNFKNSYK